MSDDERPRTGPEKWARVPELLAELATLAPGLVAFGLAVWVIFGAF